MSETQATVHDWIKETFPGTDPESPRKSIRLLEECVELCLASGASPGEVAGACRKIIHETIPQHSSDDWHVTDRRPDGIAAEAADVLIVLYGLAGMRGIDLHAEVDKKMKINRSRKWKANGDGTGYHIRDAENP